MTELEAPTASGGPATTAPVTSATSSPLGEILRDVARAGLAGIAVGTVVGGIGGRLVMRLAAVLVPSSDGIPTENGNVIGAITVEGTLALLVFGGVLSGVLAAAVWVIVRPWLPADPTWRLVVATAAAIGLGMPGLIEGDNVDFLFLRHDPLVVGSLVVLLGLFGPAMLAADGWLDRRLPRASGRDAATALYAAMAVIGAVLAFPVLVSIYLSPSLWPLGVALVVVGLATVGAWLARLRGREPPPALLGAGRTLFQATVVIGLAFAVPELFGALGID